MKKLFFIGALILLFIIPIFSQNYENAGMDYTKAIMQKTIKARITAFKAYIQQYPDTTKRFTKLAYYQLALNYFQNKNYSQAVRYGEKTKRFKDLGHGEEARIYLILGNSYAIKGSSLYNKELALKYTNKAISLARANKLNDVLSAAKNLKEKLTVPPPPSETSEQKIMRLVHQDEDYISAISFYRSLSNKDKINPSIHKAYSIALFKANKLDSALKEFVSMYAKEKTGITAYYIGNIYEKKAKRNRKLYNNAAKYYVESYLLYKKEEKKTNATSAKSYAKNMIVKKYNLQAKIDRYNAKQKKNQSSAARNKEEIASVKRQIRREKRRIDRAYPDIEPPAYEYDKTNKLQKKLKALKSGTSTYSDKEGLALQKEIKKVDIELNDLITNTKKRLEL